MANTFSLSFFPFSPRIKAILCLGRGGHTLVHVNTLQGGAGVADTKDARPLMEHTNYHSGNISGRGGNLSLAPRHTAVHGETRPAE